MSIGIAFAVLLYVAVAAAWDLRTARIPNALTYGGLIAGVAFSIFPESIAPGSALAGAAIGFLPAFVLFAFGGMGGGDVKLLAAVGALVGYPVIFDVLFYTLVVGTAISLGMIIWHGRVRELLGALKYHLLSPFYPQLQPWIPVKDLRIPFAVAVAGGALWTLALPKMSFVAAL